MKKTVWTLFVVFAISLNSCNIRPTTAPESPVADALTAQPETSSEAAPTFTPVTGAMKIDLGAGTESEHILLSAGGDVDTESVSVGEPAVSARRSGNGANLSATDGNSTPDTFIQFNVDNSVLFEGQPTASIFIELEYLDEGADSFTVQYDGATGGEFGDGRFLSTHTIYKTNSGRFKTTGFVLKDVFFGDRDNGADFRIADNLDGAETIRRVSVTLLKTNIINVDSCGADPMDDRPDSDAIQTCINKARHGDTITFTSGVNTSGYNGYLIDKTVFLMMNAPLKYATFTSTDPQNPALLKATAELKGFVVQLYARSRLGGGGGMIDYITVDHINFDGGRDVRSCFGSDNKIDGNNDNWGSWLPECTVIGDSWCTPGTLNFFGAINDTDLSQNYEADQDGWTAGLLIDSLHIANTECGTAMGMGGAGNTIINNTVDIAGDHVHDNGCQQTDEDEPLTGWSDGLTMNGPGHWITGNTIINPSDVGIVFFGGKETIIRDNIIRVTTGNYGAFAAIAVHPWGVGDVSFMRIENNNVTSEGNEQCGGIHAGINIGTHMWGGGCTYNGTAVSVGNATCSQEPPAPQGMLCPTNASCQKWAYVPAGTTFTLQNNTVSGAHINYLIEGLDLLGIFEDVNNISINPRNSDWDAAQYGCNGIFWGPTDKIAHHPSLDGWTDRIIHCER